MSALVVNNILNQINQQPNSKSIKKLLYLKLEMELNADRCIFDEQVAKENKELQNAEEITLG